MEHPERDGADDARRRIKCRVHAHDLAALGRGYALHMQMAMLQDEPFRWNDPENYENKNKFFSLDPMFVTGEILDLQYTCSPKWLTTRTPSYIRKILIEPQRANWRGSPAYVTTNVEQRWGAKLPSHLAGVGVA